MIKKLFIKKVMFIFCIVIVLAAAVLFLSSLTDKDYYKNHILDYLNKSPDFKISAEDMQFKFFPSLYLTLNNVKVKYKKITPSFILIECREIRAEISLLFLLAANIKIKSLSILNGNLNLQSVFLKNIKVTGNTSASIFSKIKKISFNNVIINYFDSARMINDMLLFDSLTVRKGFINDYIIASVLIYNKGYLKLEGILDNVNPGKIDLKAMDIYLKVSLKDFPVYSLRKYLNNNVNNIGEPRLTGTFTIKNNPNQLALIDINEMLVKNVFFDDKKTELSQINIGAMVEYSYSKNSLTFKDLRINIKDLIDAMAEGTVFIEDMGVNSSIKINAREIAVKPVLDLIGIFISFFYQNGNRAQGNEKKVTSEIFILSQKINFMDYEFTDVDCNLIYNNNSVLIDISKASIYDGNIEAQANIILGDFQKYKLNLKSYNIDAGKLFLKYTDTKYVSGQIYSNLNLTSRGNSGEDFKKNIKADGEIIIRDGELFGYANILKPLFSLGKFLNLVGPKGKSTEFKSLKLNYEIRKEIIKINSLKMEGVGLDASGKGEISFNKKIDMRIIIGLGGVAGDILRVPVIYKGDLLTHWAYIDPVWLASIYVGMVLIPGPIGAVLGPTVTETVRDWFDKIKSKFKSSGKK